MNIFEKLFGPRLEDGLENANCAASQDEQTQTLEKNQRIVFCHCCKKQRAPMVDKNGFICGAGYTGRSVDEIQKEFGHIFIGSCEPCDLDVCGFCADWRINEPLTAQHDVGYEKKGVWKMYQPHCLACNAPLEGKTAVDARRFNKGLASLPGLRPTAAKAEVFKLLRLLDENQPEFRESLGTEKFKKIQAMLVQVVGVRDGGSLTKPEKLLEVQRLSDAFHKSEMKVSSADDSPGLAELYDRPQRMRIMSHLKQLSSLDGGFASRVTGYPNIARLALAIEIEPKVDFAAATSERDSLIALMRGQLDREELKMVVEVGIKLKTGDATNVEFCQTVLQVAERNGLRMADFRNFEQFTEYERLICETSLSNAIEELRRFEIALVRELGESR